MGQLHEQTVLVVGLGHLGRGVAKRIASLGTRVLAVNRSPRTVEGVEAVAPLRELPALAQQADALVVTLPASPDTTHLVDAEVLRRLRPGATVVNIGRGTVIDEAALIEALRSGQVGFAALDVTAVEPLPQASELWDFPNVLISPHTAALSPNEDERIAELVLDNARRLMAGQQLRNVIADNELA